MESSYLYAYNLYFIVAVVVVVVVVINITSNGKGRIVHERIGILEEILGEQCRTEFKKRKTSVLVMGSRTTK